MDIPPPDLCWAVPPNGLCLSDHDIHVWSALLDLPRPEIDKLSETLCSAEQERAARFRLERDRDRFVARRGILRRLIGGYLDIDPSDVAFSHHARGKLSLAGSEGRTPVHFNLSDSSGLALYSVGNSAPLGVDVERIRSVYDPDGISARFFSPRESRILAGLTAGDKLVAFFNCWTRKEAYLKATGEGITNSLPRIEVSFLPGEPPEIVSIAGDPHAAAEWTLHSLAPASGYAGAVAIKAKGLKLSCWRWPGSRAR